ncbi:hypothetical protein ACRG00_15825 [Cronobacter sakazakii]|uniref:hypothetical protein n=1 Tax=Cronobacter sakazakii TaxID=28141 RepID=UPI003D7B1F97
MDKSREQFEEWYLRRWGHTEDNHDTLFEMGPYDDCYYRLGVRMAYDAWQASRAAVEIELPPTTEVHPLGPSAAKVFCELHKNTVAECAKAIRAAGLKVKGD